MAEEPKQHPSLMSKSSMQAMSATAGSGDLLFSEVLTKVNNAKDKAKKIEVLKRYDHPSLRMLLKGSFDPSIEWELPEGTPPFMENPAPKGTEHTILKTEAKRLWHFIKGADTKTTKTQKETLFIQMLEGLHSDEARLLLNVKDKTLHRAYKGLSDSVVKESFGWNELYQKLEQK
jgi:hypothetical protein